MDQRRRKLCTAHMMGSQSSISPSLNRLSVLFARSVLSAWIHWQDLRNIRRKSMGMKSCSIVAIGDNMQIFEFQTSTSVLRWSRACKRGLFLKFFILMKKKPSQAPLKIWIKILKIDVFRISSFCVNSFNYHWYHFLHYVEMITIKI